MKRRDFITLLGGAAATRPIAARAQQSAMPSIRVFEQCVGCHMDAVRHGIRPGLGEIGYVEGQNVTADSLRTGRIRTLAMNSCGWPLANGRRMAHARQSSASRREIVRPDAIRFNRWLT